MRILLDHLYVMAEDNKQPYIITIRWEDQSIPIHTTDSKLYGVAKVWQRIVGNRRRWSEDDEAIRNLERRAQSELAKLGVDAENIEKMAKGRHIEVSVKFNSEKVGFAARTLPWEFLLSSATRPFRNGGDFLVTRHVDAGQTAGGADRFDQMLFVQADPGKLKGQYSFDDEKMSVESIFQGQFEFEPDPSLEGLEQTIVEKSAGILHFSGFDTKQGVEEMGLAVENVEDGIFLRNEHDHAVQVGYKQLSQSFERLGNNAPCLVSFNCYNSALRLAMMSVAKGVKYSIGFQDTVSDLLAEDFYTSFYFALKNQTSDHEILTAFQAAIESVKQNHSSLRGVCIVLVSATSLLVPVLDKPNEAIFREKPILNKADGFDVNSLLKVDVKLEDEINYSMLHNGRSIFKQLELRTSAYGIIQDVDVRVLLQTGVGSFEYTATIDIDRSIEIHQDVQLPLTWDFARSLKETVIATVFVELKLKEDSLYRKTHKVRLVPPNEWKDNKKDGAWLPSFVLPRDPAVEQIIMMAKKNLRVLMANYDASFNGYQSRNPDVVDRQVEAIWSTLAFELDLTYTEPPPVYNGDDTEASHTYRYLKFKNGHLY